MTARVHDSRLCTLGEGPLWHPEREELFWFDITAGRLLSRRGEAACEWNLGECVSAAGWIDADTLLVASETALLRFEIATGATVRLAALEADRPATRSNDGRADPFGGFWIGTMGKEAEPGAGAIYRYFEGALERLFAGITIPNSICFAPDGKLAYFADTAEGIIRRQRLDGAGWPRGAAEPFLDLAAEGLHPDGSVVDGEGALWNAQWGAGRIARYAPDGHLLGTFAVGGRNSSCPAFGGTDLSTIFVTTAREGLADAGPGDGPVYSLAPGPRGQREHRVRIV
ncbi:MAG: SMP-30/gluconolactonase/LRE family protein [Defluviimonas sp.]|uniref:SMP-30/gluconolactonase/LRE family protein n=1 Tax=Albidovulum sp. TaxID=1872424 RepID=UPI001DA6EC74|nr:SMP-30/gluconolactonase/LRE family protein [Paracoccaceae bacterium]MCC0064500.1 SMP-30/gluconolactonase/LRE family protein [Defluviimonas sp.]